MRENFDRIDHVCFAVRDLAAAAAAFRSLGFTLTERADHSRPGKDGKPELIGTAQHSVTFAEDYIEIMAIVDPAKPHYLAPLLEERAGIYILALGTEDIEAAHRAAAARGAPLSEVKPWQREVFRDGVKGLARFRYCTYAMETTPEGLICPTQQLTPHLLRTPGLIDHANGALGLGELVLCASDPAAAIERYGGYLGASPARDNDMATFAIGRHRLRIGTPAALAALYSGLRPDADQRFALCSVRVADIEKARAVVSRAGWEPRPSDRGFWVASRGEFGGHLAFDGW